MTSLVYNPGRMDGRTEIFWPVIIMEPVCELYSDCATCYEAVKYQTTNLASETMLINLDKWIYHTRSRACTHYNKTKPRVGNGTPSGAFAFTLTKSPTDPFRVGDMLSAVRKLMVQKSCPVTRYAWYLEDKGKDENGEPIHPHIHGMYETATSGRIEAKHFKRAWPIWDEKVRLGAGFKGGYHRPVKYEESYSDYIGKDGGVCEKNVDE